MVKTFIAEDESRKTIYSIIKKLEDGIAIKRKVGSGLKLKIFNSRKLLALRIFIIIVTNDITLHYRCELVCLPLKDDPILVK